MKHKSLFVVLGVFLIVLFNSFIYGALNTEMFIDGDVYVRVDRNIRVTGVKVIEQTNGAYETYNCDYSKDTTSIQATLPSSDSFIIYEVTITNKGDIDYEVSNIVEESYSNSNIKYEIIDLEKGTVVDGETTHTFKIKLTSTESDSENKGTLVLKYIFEEWIPSLYNMVAHKSRSLDTNLDFGVAPTKETSGVYEMDSTKDDEYPVYYYRGIIDNNNVSFAGFCWKAVRTTSTGGVKLIYNGVPASDGSCDNTSEASYIGISQFNSGYSPSTDRLVSALYLGYRYNATDSTIKTLIDKWYFDNMMEYTDMLEDTIWCNDRSVSDTGDTTTSYGGYGRLILSPVKPIVTCPDRLDSFTVSDSVGNGELTYPVALLTADEMVLAGVTGNGNHNNYLYINENWWTMSPCHVLYKSDRKAWWSDIFHYNNDYGLNATQPHATSSAVRPSISLVFTTMIKEGNGSVTNPYKLVEDKITKEWTFDYTGGEQEFKVPYDGVYKLETWGAQGGNSTSKANIAYNGGYGAYSVGNIQMNYNDVVYIVVGGQEGKFGGGTGSSSYNGNSNGGDYTSINLESGKLSEFESKKDKILIVAGGGGGSYGYPTSSTVHYSGNGGIAGGYKGGAGEHSGDYYWLASSGGTQELGGQITPHPSYGNFDGGYKEREKGYFGIGGYTETTSGGGGGGGYYGGGFSHYAGGSGGSGYIGNTLLSNKIMYCYGCEESNEVATKTVSTTNVSEEPISNYAKKGNGHVKITLIEKK